VIHRGALVADDTLETVRGVPGASLEDAFVRLTDGETAP
jgi:hypothetical protein